MQQLSFAHMIEKRDYCQLYYCRKFLNDIAFTLKWSTDKIKSRVQSSHLAYTGTATGYCGDFYSQSGKIKDYILSFQSLFDNIHQEKHVLLDDE